MKRYTEILKLKEMLEKANIPFTFTDDFFGAKKRRSFDGQNYPAYQIRLNKDIDVVQHFGSYGEDKNLLEIMGGLTEEERETNGVLGNLTAEEVFKRFKYCYENGTAVYKVENSETKTEQEQINELAVREILFRGKRVDNGEWVEGDLLRSRGKCYIHMHTDPFDYLGELSGFIKMYEVEPHTVRQYTGLTDKNGKKIFEGDICGCFCKTQIFEVKYCDDRCGYFFDDCVTSGGCKSAPECLGNLRNTIEVIGNIHDNKELLNED